MPSVSRYEFCVLFSRFGLEAGDVLPTIAIGVLLVPGTACWRLHGSGVQFFLPPTDLFCIVQGQYVQLLVQLRSQQHLREEKAGLSLLGSRGVQLHAEGANNKREEQLRRACARLELELGIALGRWLQPVCLYEVCCRSVALPVPPPGWPVCALATCSLTWPLAICDVLAWQLNCMLPCWLARCLAGPASLFWPTNSLPTVRPRVLQTRAGDDVLTSDLVALPVVLLLAGEREEWVSGHEQYDAALREVATMVCRDEERTIQVCCCCGCCCFAAVVVASLLLLLLCCLLHCVCKVYNRNAATAAP